MFMPVSLMCLLMKPITIGAAMVSRLPVAPGDKLDARLMAFVTVFSPPPNKAESRLFPAVIQDEFGSDTAGAICDQDEPVRAPLGTISSIFRNMSGLSDLLARPLSKAANDGSIARETACVG
jgi:hypothetical protein